MKHAGTVLMTGAHGGLGRAWMRALSADGHTVYACTRAGEAQTYACDLQTPGAFTALLYQLTPQMVLHLAADFGADLAQAMRVNFESARELLQWAKTAHHRPRIVLIGTAAEYGAVPADAGALKETQVLAPVSAYGVSKACQSQLLSLFASQGVDVVGARLFNLRASDPNTTLSTRMFVGRISEQIRQIQAGAREFIEVGSLDAQRDFIFIDEAIVQLNAIVERGQAGEIYHVASGTPISMHELLAQELQAAKLSFAHVRSAPELSNRTGVDVPIIYADISKIQGLLASSAIGSLHA